jgi:succinate-acetate transporter protein
MAFAVTSFVLSCYDAGIWGIQVDSPPNVVTGLLVFYGGMAMGLAGVWEYTLGRNTHGGIGFVSVAAFFLAYATIGLLPGFGVLQAYEPANIKNIDPAIGIFLLAWVIFAVFLWLGTIRSSNVVLSGLFFFFMLSLLLGCIAEFKQGDHIGLRCKRVLVTYQPFVQISVAQYSCHQLSLQFHLISHSVICAPVLDSSLLIRTRSPDTCPK